MQQVVQRKIMWGDLDSLGIVYYPRYYEWIDGCSHLYFESIDLHLELLRKKRNLVFGLVETTSRYETPGRYHQTIQITTELTEISDKTAKFKHSIACRSSGKVLLNAFEKRICMNVEDPQRIRAVDIPDDILAALEKAKVQP
jgi:YbgC/YbaW family acyl-CoA thioester hydrolase